MKKFFLLFNLLLLLTSPLPAETQEEECPAVILGGGIGALTSAVYLSRAGITPIVITGSLVGGTITQSHNVQNWPGEFAISGIDLGEKVQKQAELNGAILQPEVVVAVDFSKRPYIITTKKAFDSSDQYKRYKTQTVIIALGATPNLLNIPGETGKEGYWSRGVYSCAVCDGSLYKDKEVAVVGGGDSALLEAQYLSNIASKVHLIVRRDAFRSVEKERMKEILSRPNIQVHYKTVVKEIKGDGQKVTHLVIQDSAKDKSWNLPIDALFLAIGSLPNTELFRNQIELDPEGYIVLKKHQQTSLEGVYAIGDVSDPDFKQAISAAGDAAKAALQAQKYLASHEAIAPSKPQPVAVEEKPLMVAQTIEINSRAQFDKEVRHAGCTVFLDFYSVNCAPCRRFSRLYEEWAKNYGNKIKFLKINADKSPDIFREYQVRVIPTVVILDKQGKLIRKIVDQKEITELDKQLGQMKDKPLDFRR